MPKPNFQAIVISRVINAAPHLRFVAFYHADETRVNACMHGYEGRAFVYVLTTVFEDTEHFLYVGKSKAQYSRFLMHLKAYAFQHIYLFECDLEHQGESEVATIKELKPLYNRHHNPLFSRNQTILGINYEERQSAEGIMRHLTLQKQYAPVGLFGFSLPPAVFRVLEEKAAEQHCNCSDMLQLILEKTYPQEIAAELHNPTEQIQTNLITSQQYAQLHNRSREQVKQYFLQGNRINGAARIGRDWVLPKDAYFPEDRRRKVSK